MPMSPLDAERLLATTTNELVRTPMPFFGVNIIDVSQENFQEFVKKAAVYSEFGNPVPDVLQFSPYHSSMRDYGNGRIRVLTMLRYTKPFDKDAYIELTGTQEFADYFMDFCNLIENYQWFTSCDITVIDAPNN